MKRARDEEDNHAWSAPASDKKPRLFSDFLDNPVIFDRPLPVRINSEPFPSQFSYRRGANAGISDGSSHGSPESMGSPVDMPDVDMDDEFSIVGSFSPPTPPPLSNRPAKLIPSPYRGTTLAQGRIPTPTARTFAQGAASPTVVNGAGLFGTLQEGRLSSPIATSYRRLGLARDYHMPSPIHESLYSPARDAVHSPNVSPRSQHALLPALQTPATAAHDMSRLSMNGDGMDVENRPPADLDSPTTVRMGRQRSGALFTEKKKYHLGYLDGCEKCRTRVPGHVSHFLPVDA